MIRRVVSKPLNPNAILHKGNGQSQSHLQEKVEQDGRHCYEAHENLEQIEVLIVIGRDNVPGLACAFDILVGGAILDVLGRLAR